MNMATVTSRLLAERLPDSAEGQGVGRRPWRAVARAAAILTLVGSAVIHFSQVRAHLQEWRPSGITFLVLAGAELVLAVAMLIGASRPAYLLGIWVSQATILLWLLSRTVGIPFGPEAFVPERVGRPDLTATVLEAITLAALFPLFLVRSGRSRATRLAGRGYLAVGLMAMIVGSATWFAVLPSGSCHGHGGAESLTGPLVPVDGHSMLDRNTPIAEAKTGREVGLVVGLLHNCDSSALAIRSARLTGVTDFEMAGRAVSFWVVPPSLARPGEVIPLEVLRRGGKPLPGGVEVRSEEKTTGFPGLVLLVHATRPGDFSVSALEVTYTAGGRTYVSPYATIARLRIS
jgi:hypothetical protein